MTTESTKAVAERQLEAAERTDRETRLRELERQEMERREEEAERIRKDQEDSPYLTYREAALYCNVERTTIYRAVIKSTLQASGPGSAVRFHRDDLDEWMRSRGRGAGASK